MPDEPKPNEEEALSQDPELETPEAKSETSDMPEQEFSQDELDALKVEQETTLGPEADSDTEMNDNAETQDSATDAESDDFSQTSERNAFGAENNDTPASVSDNNVASGMDEALRNHEAEEMNSTDAGSATTDVTPPPAITIQPKKHNKKKLIIGLVVGVGVMLLAGGGAAAYNLWYQNPQKVVSDAVMNAIKADTVKADMTMDIRSRESADDSEMQTSLFPAPERMNIKVSSATNYTSSSAEVQISTDIEGKKYDFTLGGQIDEAGTVNFRIDDLKQKVEQALADSGDSLEALPEPLRSIINKVDGNWVRIGAEDISVFDKEAGEEYKQQYQCTTKALSTFRDSDEQQQEIINAYQANDFMSDIEYIGSKDGNLGYKITTDEQKSDNFSKALENTTVIKELNKCTGDDDDESEDTRYDSSSDSDDTATATFWISRFGHELKHIDITGDDAESEVDVTAKVDLSYNEPFSVATPENQVTLTELKSDIEALMQVFLGSFSGGSATTLSEPTRAPSGTL